MPKEKKHFPVLNGIVNNTDATACMTPDVQKPPAHLLVLHLTR